MYLRVYASLRGLTPEEKTARYVQHRMIWDDLKSLPGGSGDVGGSDTADVYILISTQISNASASYKAPEGWLADTKEDLGDPNYKIKLF